MIYCSWGEYANQLWFSVELYSETEITRCCTLRRAMNTPTRSFMKNSKSHGKQEVDVQ
jgi:hypothetical protein